MDIKSTGSLSRLLKVKGLEDTTHLISRDQSPSKGTYYWSFCQLRGKYL